MKVKVCIICNTLQFGCGIFVLFWGGGGGGGGGEGHAPAVVS